MCFSFEASVMAAGVCTLFGIAALSLGTKEERMIASIPLIFGTHQAVEAVVWATRGAGIGRYFVLAYCVIAYCVWPTYVPIAMKIQNLQRSNLLNNICLSVGLLLSFYFAYVLLYPITIDIAEHHIQYIPSIYIPHEFDYGYAFCAVVPFLIVKNKLQNLFAVLLTIYFIVAMLWFNPARDSVWCYFAATSSVILLFSLRKNNLLKLRINVFHK